MVGRRNPRRPVKEKFNGFRDALCEHACLCDPRNLGRNAIRSRDGALRIFDRVAVKIAGGPV
jgi:hypothetical protein